MNKILLLGSLSKKRNRLDGVTIKTRTLFQAITDEGINIKYIDTDDWIKNCLFITLKLLKNYRKTEVIILSCADRGAYYALKLLKMLRYKGSIYYFVAGGRLADNIKLEKYNKKYYEICTKIYVESEEIKNDLEKMNLKNIEQKNNFRIVPYNIDVKPVGDKVKCVYFGRVIPEKGIEDAIEVVQNLINKGYKVSFDIYGQINMDYLNQISGKLNKDIIYKGTFDESNDKYLIISQYDILLFPTKYPGECLPGTLIESYISGLAIIASNWRYANEYISDNEVGYIYKFNNSNDFEVKLEKALKDHNKVNLFKKASKQKGNCFNSSIVLEDVFNILKNI